MDIPGWVAGRLNIYSGGTQDSVQASRLQVSYDHRNTKSKSKNIQRRDGESRRMIKMKLLTNFDLLIWYMA